MSGLECSARVSHIRLRFLMPQVPNSHARKLPNKTRRTLLKAGIAGGVVLVLARWMVTSHAPRESAEGTRSALDSSARTIIAAIVPVLLEGAIPDVDTSVEARAEVVAGVDRAVAGLPPGSRKELEQLFALLSFAPTRCLLAGVWSSWPDASRCSFPDTARCISSSWLRGTAMRAPGRRLDIPGRHRWRSADGSGIVPCCWVARPISYRTRERLEGHRRIDVVTGSH